MQTGISLKEALWRASQAAREPDPPVDPEARRVVLGANELPRPVAVARILGAHGVRLREAHSALNRLAETGTAVVTVAPHIDVPSLSAALSGAGVWISQVEAHS